MRIFSLLLISMTGLAMSAHAADEFGTRFSEDTPVALEDTASPEDTLGAALSDIAPAAGEASEPQTGGDDAQPAQNESGDEAATSKESETP